MFSEMESIVNFKFCVRHSKRVTAQAWESHWPVTPTGSQPGWHLHLLFSVKPPS